MADDLADGAVRVLERLQGGQVGDVLDELLVQWLVEVELLVQQLANLGCHLFVLIERPARGQAAHEKRHRGHTEQYRYGFQYSAEDELEHRVSAWTSGWGSALLVGLHLEVKMFPRMVVEHVRMPVFDGGIQRVHAGVNIDRQNRQLVHQYFLRLLEQLQSGFWVLRDSCLADQCVVIVPSPAGLVLLTPRGPHVEERVRIGVVARPAGTADLVVHFTLTIEVHLPFLVLQRDVDVQVFLPHLLDGLGDDAVPLGGVVEEFERGKAFAVRVAGLGEQLPGFLDVFLDPRPGGVAVDAWWGEKQRRHLFALGHVFRDAAAVKRHRQGLANADVVARLPCGVEPVKVRGQVRLDS